MVRLLWDNILFKEEKHGVEGDKIIERVEEEWLKKEYTLGRVYFIGDKVKDIEIGKLYVIDRRKIIEKVELENIEYYVVSEDGVLAEAEEDAD